MVFYQGTHVICMLWERCEGNKTPCKMHKLQCFIKSGGGGE